MRSSSGTLGVVEEQVNALKLALDDAHSRIDFAEHSSADALQQLEQKSLELHISHWGSEWSACYLYQRLGMQQSVPMFCVCDADGGLGDETQGNGKPDFFLLFSYRLSANANQTLLGHLFFRDRFDAAKLPTLGALHINHLDVSLILTTQEAAMINVLSRPQKILHEAFQDKQEHLVISLETEKRICMERLRRAEKRVESLEKELQSRPASSPANGKPRSPGGQDTYDGQVNFLNSIIVDLHAKNAKLEEQLREALNPRSATSKKSSSAEASKPTAKLRFWCDHCEVFDLHDTDACPSLSAGPRQSNQPPRLAKTVGPSVNRAYCDNCEVFDKHNTEDCPEVQAY
ncbi:unnamed protein product [Dibothriocephalus latus]|uniref:CLIP1 zinc knuckle domain-containing protein n=1 Tax=Dibothriocephalus latus TaxID=60516 RepID=A0A3P7LFN8_DIBLA|nr:unnamed protein product [Dibothriocephalus latus]